MKLEDVRSNYEYFSSTLSSINRQICFAGIAIVWIFVTRDNNLLSLPEGLVSPLKSFLAALSFDMFHYIYATIIWGWFHRSKELSLKDENEEFLAPRVINWPSIYFMWIKVAFTILAYIMLMYFMWNLFEHN